MLVSLNKVYISNSKPVPRLGRFVGRLVRCVRPRELGVWGPLLRRQTDAVRANGSAECSEGDGV